MPERDVASAERSDLKTAFGSGTDNYYSVDPQTTDGATGLKKTEYINSKWNQQLGYYKEIPELSSVIDAKATWTVGKGFTVDEENVTTEIVLRAIKGNGTDTFNTILENCIRTYNIGGDSFCEIIRTDEEVLINLKPLDPSSIKIITNLQGIIIKYEQISKNGKPNKPYEPDQIFHLARNRVADEIHGQNMIDKLVPIILFKNEAMADWRRVLHRNIEPLWIFHMDTDNTTVIGAFKAKMDAARGKGENMYIPKGAIVPELIGTAPNASLNPLATIEMADAKFYEAAQVPKIIVGGVGGFTEAAVKIAYLAFQQTIEEEQLFIEEQVFSQLGLEIELEFPVSLENEALSEKPKAEERPIENESAAQPNDTTAEMEGNK